MRDLAQETEAPLHWYAIFNGTCDDKALADFYRFGGNDAKPLWSGTPYAEWHEVMPYIADVSHMPDFITWTEQEANEDWGILVASTLHLPDIFQHFRSLTLVWMPSGNHAFFRFYDPRFSIDLANFCDEEQRNQVMGPCQQWVSKQRTVTNSTPASSVVEKPFPWWEVPEAVVKKLSNDPRTLATNLIKEFQEQRPDLFCCYPEKILNQKVARFIKNFDGPQSTYLTSFIELIEAEQMHLGNLR
ncbi:hypothetical protein GCE9029_02078 [Grimontia celer]|uniref:DUF4123 domain-containing protein n=1 Tax=Grimontia celer TaxID=1796497 RepID=A0A128F1D9_9GAMM|nr:DUF4123 domain-containing protein [Grimontia celer]CZF80589.1 hypothetical protein GCE9029_02078 [Grimontia celer]